MKTDPTTNVLLGVIATGVAALTALAFEKRYRNCSATSVADDIKDAAGHAYERISRNVQHADREVRHEAASLKERVEDGIDSVKEKAGSFKERISDSFERVGNHLHAGADKLKDSFRNAAGEIKEGAQDAAEDARKAAAAAAAKF